MKSSDKAVVAIIIVTILIITAIGFCTYWFCFRNENSQVVKTPGSQTPQQGGYRKGSSGSRIEKLQTALNELGGYGLKVDGVWGSATDEAVKDWFGKDWITEAELKSICREG